MQRRSMASPAAKPSLRTLDLGSVTTVRAFENVRHAGVRNETVGEVLATATLTEAWGT